MRAPAPTTPSPYAVLRWLVLATFIVILNETIMINAIPRLMVEFDVTAGPKGPQAENVRVS